MNLYYRGAAGSARKFAEERTELNSIQNVTHKVYKALPGSRIAEVFENCYSNAITKTLQRDPDGTCLRRIGSSHTPVNLV